MWTRVRHRTTAQVIDQIFEFGSGKRIVGFHRMTTNRFGNHVFAEPQRVHFLPGGFEFIDEFEHELPRVRRFHHRRESIEQKRALAEFAQADPEPREHFQLPAQETRVANGELNGLGQQQFLGRRLLIFFQPIQHLLKKNSLMRGVLIEQHQSAIGFQNDVKLADDSDQSQRHAKQWNGSG